MKKKNQPPVRKTLYQVIEMSDDASFGCKVYNYSMIVVIFASLVPLAFKEEPAPLLWIENIATGIFIMDYFLRLITADYKLKGKSSKPFLRYPFTALAIIDLLSILPSLAMPGSAFALFRILRIARELRVIRIFRAMRYSKSLLFIGSIFKKQKAPLMAVATLALCYVFVSALIIFNVEPHSFDTFFHALYWATISVTTVGYGDIAPETTIGRAVAMLSSIFSIAVIALPAGIISAGYMNDQSEDDSEEEQSHLE